MRKLTTMLVLVLALVAMSVDVGQSKSSPFSPSESRTGTTDDHPWGGDNSGGGDDGDRTPRGDGPAVSTGSRGGTGIWFIDFVVQHIYTHKETRKTLGRLIVPKTVVTTPSTPANSTQNTAN